ncbi:MAG: hypothetical protein BWK73_05045 [Thiothrix lacustris]|uniref:Pilus formation protein N-terminal domain-containing protein n=1 Tax=Thiothrix lacustris TaxID=525917 RepID=A0A1Y1QXE8_9GAMM|nr:MAG: hypothetical protein BWK73_05045 [Thiothrix lacustris]
MNNAAQFTINLLLSCLLIANASADESSASQRITLNVPKVALLTVTETASSDEVRLAISANDPQTTLKIIPTGMNLKVASADLICPNDSSTTTITCHVGIKRLVNSPLTLTVISTQDNASVAYQLE